MEQRTKQTPVEWLVEQVNSDCINSTFIRPELANKALEMEKSNQSQQGELMPHESYIAGYKTGQSDFQKYNLPLIMADQVPDVRKMVEISDEEIEKGAEENTCYMKDFILGAKWYREQLKKK